MSCPSLIFPESCVNSIHFCIFPCLCVENVLYFAISKENDKIVHFLCIFGISIPPQNTNTLAKPPKGGDAKPDGSNASPRGDYAMTAGCNFERAPFGSAEMGRFCFVIRRHFANSAPKRPKSRKPSPRRRAEHKENF